MTWRHYAAGVFISASVFVTGKLWHQRDSMYVAAEDAAAFAADVAERDFALFGSYIPYSPYSSGNTNAVGAARVWRRGLAPAASIESLRRHFYGSASFPGYTPRWIYGDWALVSGDEVIGFNWGMTSAWSSADCYQHSLYTNITLYYITETDAVSSTPNYATLDTRIPNGENAATSEGGVFMDGIFYPTDIVFPSFPLTNIPAASDYPYCPGAYPGPPPVENYDPFEGWPDWWTFSDLGTNVYFLREENAPYEGQHWLYARLKTRAPQTNVFNTLRQVCGSMDTAIRVGGFQSVSNVAWYGYETFGHSSTNKDDSAEEMCRTNAVVLRDEIAGRYARLGGTRQVADLNLLVDFRAGWESFDEMRYFQDEPPDGPLVAHPIYIRSAGGTLTVSVEKHYDVHCTWPSSDVYSSNLVSRVRYFAVWTTDLPKNFEPCDIYEWTDDVTFSSTPVDTLTYTQTRFPDGIERRQSLWPYRSIESTGESYYYFAEPECPSGLVLDLLADVSDPTEPPKVNIGCAPSDLNLSFIDTMALDTKQEATWRANFRLDRFEPNYSTYDVEKREYLHCHGIHLRALICVVDFKFNDYLNGGKGEPYTPPWATNAPALP